MTSEDIIAAIEAAGFTGNYMLVLALSMAHKQYALSACISCGEVGVYRRSWCLLATPDSAPVGVFTTCAVARGPTMYSCTQKMREYWRVNPVLMQPDAAGTTLMPPSLEWFND